MSIDLDKMINRYSALYIPKSPSKMRPHERLYLDFEARRRLRNIKTQSTHQRSPSAGGSIPIEDSLLQKGRDSDARRQRMREMAETIKMKEVKEKPRISKNSQLIIQKKRQHMSQSSLPRQKGNYKRSQYNYDSPKELVAHPSELLSNREATLITETEAPHIRSSTRVNTRQSPAVDLDRDVYSKKQSLNSNNSNRPSNAFNRQSSKAYSRQSSRPMEIDRYNSPPREVFYEESDITKESTVFQRPSFQFEEPNPYDRQRSPVYSRQESQAYDRQTSKTYSRQESQAHDRKPSNAYSRQESQAHDRKPSNAYSRQESQAHDRKPSNAYSRQESHAYDRKPSIVFNRQESQAYDRKPSIMFNRQESRAYDRQASKAYSRQESQAYDRKASNPYCRQQSQGRDRQRANAYERPTPYELEEPDTYDREESNLYLKESPNTRDDMLSSPTDEKHEVNPYERKMCNFDNRKISNPHLSDERSANYQKQASRKSNKYPRGIMKEQKAEEGADFSAANLLRNKNLSKNSNSGSSFICKSTLDFDSALLCRKAVDERRRRGY